MTTPQTAGRPGLDYTPSFISQDEQEQLVTTIDSLPWRKDLKRRVQHYGYVYDYKAKTINPGHYLGPLPEFLQQIAERLNTHTELFDSVPVQCIINEYVGPQGISWHYDAVTFGPAIATISLLEPWYMEFNRTYSRDKVHGDRDSLLEVGSCLIMTGDSRYKWHHSIPRLNQEKSGLERGRRLSLTFRTLRD